MSDKVVYKWENTNGKSRQLKCAPGRLWEYTEEGRFTGATYINDRTGREMARLAEHNKLLERVNLAATIIEAQLDGNETISAPDLNRLSKALRGVEALKELDKESPK